MYTVLKGRRVHDLTSGRNDIGIKPYRERILELSEWLNNLDTHDETDFTDIVRRMIDEDPDRRASAGKIHDDLKICSTSTTASFCGSFCR